MLGLCGCCAKTGRHSLAIRIGPPQRWVNAHILQNRVQFANSALQAIQEFRGLAPGRVHSGKFPPVLEVHQAASEDYSLTAHAFCPIDRENRWCKTAARTRDPGFPVARRPAVRWPAASVNFGCALPARPVSSRDIAFVASSTFRARICPPAYRRHTGSENSIASIFVFSKIRTPLFSAARARPLTIFPGLTIPPGTSFTARSVPESDHEIGESWQRVAAADFVHAGQREVAMNFQPFQDGTKSGEDISEAGKIAGSGFRQNHAPGMAAGTSADRCSFEQCHALFGFELAQPGRGGKTGESSADYGEIDFRGHRLDGGMEINRTRENFPRADGKWRALRNAHG